MHYIGIDIGGTDIKGVICDEGGRICAEGSTETCGEAGDDAVCEKAAKLVRELAKDRGREIAGVGIGCPGMVDGESGTVIFAGNLGFRNLGLAKKMTALTGYKVAVANDANVAALGEARFGAGSGYRNSVLVTLGTGIGGGIVTDGRLFEGGKTVGTEIGHMVICSGGRRCTCGRRGCFETYASASALRYDLSEAMRNNPQSKMWETVTPETCTAKTAFDYLGKDAVADEVVGNYIEWLSEGLANIVNIFRPEIIMLGGGVSAQGKTLTVPLQKKVDAKLFGGTAFAPVKIAVASLGNHAGSLGAAALAMDGRQG